MLDQKLILNSFRDELAEKLANYKSPALQPLPISPWLAMSILQKSIRRGHLEWGLKAAATLQISEPDRLWRRLSGITFEDVALGDICMVGLATTALAGKRVRAELGGEWKVAAWLVETLTRAPKSRMSDDLLMACQALPALARQRDDFAVKSHDELRRIIFELKFHFEKAVAMIYLAGTDSRPPTGFKPRNGEPALAFHVADELGGSPTIIAICKEGHRRTRDPLALLLPLLEVEQEGGSKSHINDALPLEAMAGPIPCWALDMFTREGKEALRRFLGTGTRTAEWLEKNLTPRQRLPFLSLLIFHSEGGKLINRLQTELAGSLRRANEEEASGVEPAAMREATAIIQDDFATLNDIRRQILGGKNNA